MTLALSLRQFTHSQRICLILGVLISGAVGCTSVAPPKAGILDGAAPDGAGPGSDAGGGGANGDAGLVGDSKLATDGMKDGTSVADGSSLGGGSGGSDASGGNSGSGGNDASVGSSGGGDAIGGNSGSGGNDTSAGGSGGSDASGGNSGSGGKDASAGGSGGSDANAGSSGGGGSGGPDAAPDLPTLPPDAPSLLAVGAPCSASSDCAAGNCADGVCCAGPCAGCNACSHTFTSKDDGVCAPVSSGQDPHNTCTDETTTKPCGNDGTCDGAGACRKVVSNSKICTPASCSADNKTYTPAATCDGAGACPVAKTQDCGAFQCALTGCLKTCAAQGDCDTASYCDTTAKTCAAKLSNGSAASQGFQCTSGIVADGVCCNQDCTGCSACTLALNAQSPPSTNGQCLAVLAGHVGHNTCTASPPCGLDGMCDGSGGCSYTPAGTSCGTPSCSGSTLTTSTCDSTHSCKSADAPCQNALVCASVSACKTAPCTADADCITADYCAATGTCTPKLGNGHGCTAGSQCTSGNCVEGVCCNSACGQTCHSCLGSKTSGTDGTCGTMNDGTACGTTGQYCSAGTCKTGCSIGGAFYLPAAANPTNACQTCQPASSSTGWTTSPPGTNCGSGAVCNLAGTCQGGCWIAGAFFGSGIGNSTNVCQSCQPSVSTSLWSPVQDGTSCGSALICGSGTCQSGCYVGGALYGSGAMNPGNACQTCNPAVSTASWYQVPSDCSQIAAHGSFTCAAINGSAKCWGSNSYGYLGNGTTSPSPIPVGVSGLSANVQAVAPGGDSGHSCALVGGGVKCWGWNNNGQLGNGSTDYYVNVPVQVSGLTSGVRGIAIGNWHSCALLSNQVECWGYNFNGQLGTPPPTSSSVPVSGPGGTIQAITAGGSHSCALSNGAVWCWGYNGYGQLGNGSTTDSYIVVQVTGATSGVQAISAGTWHTCGIWSSSVHCWGNNVMGQLGNNSTTNSSVPVSVTGLPSGEPQAIAGGLWHTCALVNGGMYCWGYNSSGQLGNNSTSDSWVPVPVSGLGSGVQAITAGASHSCALVSGGAKCWGDNYNGELGNNSTINSLVPVTVQGL